MRDLAAARASTRATMAMRRNAGLIHGGIVAIGNAPTALLEVLRSMAEEEMRPALIVGVPVGFVNAAESKQALASLDVPYVTALGRKGGSSVAVAIVNALLRLADAGRGPRPMASPQAEQALRTGYTTGACAAAAARAATRCLITGQARDRDRHRSSGAA